MKIGIIVYSNTGNTYSVADNLEKSLKTSGYNVSLERITAEVSSSDSIITLKDIPEIKDYDLLIFASFVQAFSLSPVMKDYLKTISSLNEKKVNLFVTQHFPKPWMGGNKAIREMKTFCKQKGAVVLKTGVINWTSKKREEQITDLINEFKKVIEEQL